jgi:ABC-type polar amino acid transport system ATPase subunit
LIKVVNLHKSFGQLQVLKGVNFSVASSEVVCVIGPSGSGKSTLLRCINQLETGHRVFLQLGQSESARFPVALTKPSLILP